MSIAWHAIRDHLTRSSTNLHFQRSFDAIRRTQAALAPFRDPAALLDGLHRTTGDPVRKNLILSTLVEAAQGDAQWSVLRTGARGKVATSVARLDRAARVEELARMLGGAEITATTRSSMIVGRILNSRK